MHRATQSQVLRLYVVLSYPVIRVDKVALPRRQSLAPRDRPHCGCLFSGQGGTYLLTYLNARSASSCEDEQRLVQLDVAGSRRRVLDLLAQRVHRDAALALVPDAVPGLCEGLWQADRALLHLAHLRIQPPAQAGEARSVGWSEP